MQILLRKIQTEKPFLKHLDFLVCLCDWTYTFSIVSHA